MKKLIILFLIFSSVSFAQTIEKVDKDTLRITTTNEKKILKEDLVIEKETIENEIKMLQERLLKINSMLKMFD